MQNARYRIQDERSKWIMDQLNSYDDFMECYV